MNEKTSHRPTTLPVLHVRLQQKLSRIDGWYVFFTEENADLRTKESPGLLTLGELANSGTMRDWISTREPDREPVQGLVRIVEEHLCLPLWYKGAEVLVALDQNWILAVAPLVRDALKLAKQVPMRSLDFLPGKENQSYIPQLEKQGF